MKLHKNFNRIYGNPVKNKHCHGDLSSEGQLNVIRGDIGVMGDN